MTFQRIFYEEEEEEENEEEEEWKEEDFNDLKLHSGPKTNFAEGWNSISNGLNILFQNNRLLAASLM